MPRVTKDLTNQRFGRLVALKRVNIAGQSKWECLCECGNIKEVSTNALVSGDTKSCGCLKKSKIKDLTNQRFGKLVAIRRIDEPGLSKWLCQCDCGNVIEMSAHRLLGGKAKSCGCITKARTKDLTNQRFGSLVAIRKVNTTGLSRWECQCECGNIKEFGAANLLSGGTQSCGSMEHRFKRDLTNQRFNKLVAIRRVNTKGQARWECRCDCGNVKEFFAYHLLV
jgi:hypothetical protein